MATVSGIVVVNTMEFIESDAARFATEQQATARLIHEMQSEEGNLSAVFYSLASGRESVDGEPRSGDWLRWRQQSTGPPA